MLTDDEAYVQIALGKRQCRGKMVFGLKLRSSWSLVSRCAGEQRIGPAVPFGEGRPSQPVQLLPSAHPF